jgi:hypothetical protein
MRHLTQHGYNRIARRLDQCPRKRLGFHTPKECYEGWLLHFAREVTPRSGVCGAARGAIAARMSPRKNQSQALRRASVPIEAQMIPKGKVTNPVNAKRLSSR